MCSLHLTHSLWLCLHVSAKLLAIVHVQSARDPLAMTKCLGYTPSSYTPSSYTLCMQNMLVQFACNLLTMVVPYVHEINMPILIMHMQSACH